jgi:exopolyphosphatase/guanosine-5'-triphosphate,3'-diphosphate pyrophosphatase
MKHREIAIIDIGSATIRLTIATVTGEGSWQILEQANKPVSLGWDVFAHKRISHPSIHQTIQILSGYLELLNAYAVEDIRPICSSYLRQTQNMDTFLDLVSVHTELDIKVMEEAEEFQYIYLSILHGLNQIAPCLNDKPILILEVAAGKTYLLVIEKGIVTVAKTLDLSTTRMIHDIDRNLPRPINLEAVQERIEKTVGSLENVDIPNQIESIVAAGGQLLIAAEFVELPGKGNTTCIAEKDLIRYINWLVKSIDTDGIEVLDEKGQVVENLLFTFLIYSHFLRNTTAKRLIIPWVSVSDGILWDIALDSNEDDRNMFQAHALSSSRCVARKYRADLVHAENVKIHSLQLFDYLKEEFGLTAKQRFYLEIAALLHDVGRYIDRKGHNFHGQYLVNSETIFGLSEFDRDVVGNLILGHCGEISQKENVSAGFLSKEEQVGIAKTAAILRLGEVLDGSHKQKISNFTLEKTDMDLVIHPTAAEDLSLEKRGVLAQSHIFEDVFGLKPILI